MLTPAKAVEVLGAEVASGVRQVERTRVGAIGRVPTEDCALVATLLAVERLLGADSSYAPWLDVMPPAFPHISLDFDEAMLRLLGTAAAKTIVSIRDDYISLGRGVERLAERYPNVFFATTKTDDPHAAGRPASPEQLASFRQAFAWAIRAVNSRAFGPYPGISAGFCNLVPGLDMLNHADGVQTVLTEVAVNGGGKDGADLKNIGFQAARDFASGEEVFYGYDADVANYPNARLGHSVDGGGAASGAAAAAPAAAAAAAAAAWQPKCNHQMLMAYGFVLPDKARDCVPVSVEWVPDNSSALGRCKSAVLASGGFKDAARTAGSFNFRDGGVAPRSLLALLRVMYLTRSELRNIFRAPQKLAQGTSCPEGQRTAPQECIEYLKKNDADSPPPPTLLCTTEDVSPTNPFSVVNEFKVRQTVAEVLTSLLIDIERLPEDSWTSNTSSGTSSANNLRHARIVAAGGARILRQAIADTRNQWANMLSWTGPIL